jgi:hypothetical protein
MQYTAFFLYWQAPAWKGKIYGNYNILGFLVGWD